MPTETMRSEGALHRPVVLQAEPYRRAQAGVRGPLSGHPLLLFRERHPRDAGIARLCQVKGEAAPSRADVEHPKAGAVEQQLGGDVDPLVALGLLQGLVR